MVSATNIAGNGLKDWILQRVTSLFFAVYAVFVLGFIMLHPELSYDSWRDLFNNPVMAIASSMALVCLSLHAWIGLWTVTTDYLRCNVIRMIVQTIIMTWLLAQFVWGLLIVWGQ